MSTRGGGGVPFPRREKSSLELPRGDPVPLPVAEALEGAGSWQGSQSSDGPPAPGLPDSCVLSCYGVFLL